MVDANLVESIKSVVENTGVFEQLAEVGKVECVWWFVIWVCLAILTLIVTFVVPRHVNSLNGESEEDRRTELTFVYVLGLVTFVLFVIGCTCTIVTYYNFCHFPKAMALQIILKRI